MIDNYLLHKDITCEKCGLTYRVYEDEDSDMYEFDGYVLCKDCFKERMRDFMIKYEWGEG